MNMKKDKNVKPDGPASQASMPANAGGEGLHGLDQILAPQPDSHAQEKKEPTETKGDQK